MLITLKTLLRFLKIARYSGCMSTKSVILQTKGTVLLVYLWHMYGAHTVCRPKVTMFAVEMWFGAGEGVEYGRSTGLCPLPLGVPRCVIHDKKNVGTKFLVILKKK